MMVNRIELVRDLQFLKWLQHRVTVINGQVNLLIFSCQQDRLESVCAGIHPDSVRVVFLAITQLQPQVPAQRF